MLKLAKNTCVTPGTALGRCLIGPSVAMETKMPKCNHAQMNFSNTTYEIDFIININSEKYLFVGLL